MRSTNVAQGGQAFVATAHQAFAFQTPAIGATLLEVVAKWIQTIIDGPADSEGRVADVANITRLCWQDLRRCLDILLTDVVYWLIVLYLWFFDDYKYSKKHYQK